MKQALGPGQEFRLIEALFGGSEYIRTDAKGPGDDAWIFPCGDKWIAATVDASVESVHFRLDWCKPERALRKCLLANLSDLNAMGAYAQSGLLALGARPEWDLDCFKKMGEAWTELGKLHQFSLVGGDTVKSPNSAFFSITMLGTITKKPLLRSDAKPGQGLYISGFPGRSAIGLTLLKRGLIEGEGSRAQTSLIRAHLDPEPPLALGPILSGIAGTGCAIDLSDGLSSELWHLARQSGCALVVEWDKLPQDKALTQVASPREIREAILNGGEDYQLVFSGTFSENDLAQLSEVALISKIGWVEVGEGVFLIEDDGRREKLLAGGFSH